MGHFQCASTSYTYPGTHPGTRHDRCLEHASMVPRCSSSHRYVLHIRDRETPLRLHITAGYCFQSRCKAAVSFRKYSRGRYMSVVQVHVENCMRDIAPGDMPQPGTRHYHTWTRRAKVHGVRSTNSAYNGLLHAEFNCTEYSVLRPEVFQSLLGSTLISWPASTVDLWCFLFPLFCAV